jgi:hypothetical protein
MPPDITTPVTITICMMTSTGLLITWYRKLATSTFMTFALMVTTKVPLNLITELLQPYFRDESIGAGVYGFNPEVIFDSQAEQVYDSLYTDFMNPEIERVQFLLHKKIPVLIYNGQQDLIVSNPGTMRWADRLFHDSAHEFR